MSLRSSTQLLLVASKHNPLDLRSICNNLALDLRRRLLTQRCFSQSAVSIDSNSTSENVLQTKSIPGTQRRFWSDISRRREWLSQSGKSLGVQSLSNWYKISSDQILAMHGSSFIKKYYRGSLYLALKDVYSDHVWHPWLFESRIRSIWNHDGVKTDFFDWSLREVLKKQTLEDWYNVKYHDLVQLLRQAGVPITVIQNYCGGSMVNALKEAYPSHEWQEWRFAKVPKGFWSVAENRKRYFDWIGQKLNIKTPDDWYGVTYNQVAELGAHGILQTQYNSSLSAALQDIYADHRWSAIKFSARPAHG